MLTISRNKTSLGCIFQSKTFPRHNSGYNSAGSPSSFEWPFCCLIFVTRVCFFSFNSRRAHDILGSIVPNKGILIRSSTMAETSFSFFRRHVLGSKSYRVSISTSDTLFFFFFHHTSFVRAKLFTQFARVCNNLSCKLFLLTFSFFSNVDIDLVHVLFIAFK